MFRGRKKKSIFPDIDLYKEINCKKVKTSEFVFGLSVFCELFVLYIWITAC